MKRHASMLENGGLKRARFAEPDEKEFSELKNQSSTTCQSQSFTAFSDCIPIQSQGRGVEGYLNILTNKLQVSAIPESRCTTTSKPPPVEPNSSIEMAFKSSFSEKKSSTNKAFKKPRSKSSSSSDYLRLIACLPSDKDWKAREDQELIDGTLRGCSYEAISRNLSKGLVSRSEKDCRERVNKLKESEGILPILWEWPLEKVLRHRKITNRGAIPFTDEETMELFMWKYYDYRGIDALVFHDERCCEELMTELHKRSQDLDPHLLKLAVRRWRKQLADERRLQNEAIRKDQIRKANEEKVGILRKKLGKEDLKLLEGPDKIKVALSLLDYILNL